MIEEKPLLIIMLKIMQVYTLHLKDSQCHMINNHQNDFNVEKKRQE